MKQRKYFSSEDMIMAEKNKETELGYLSSPRYALVVSRENKVLQPITQNPTYCSCSDIQMRFTQPYNFYHDASC